MTDAEKRVDAIINKYVDHFNLGIPEGFASCELKDPNDPAEWERVLGEAIEFNEPFDYCCEGVFDEEEIMEQERLRASRKARIAKAKGEA